LIKVHLISKGVDPHEVVTALQQAGHDVIVEDGTCEPPDRERRDADVTVMQVDVDAVETAEDVTIGDTAAKSVELVFLVRGVQSNDHFRSLFQRTLARHVLGVGPEHAPDIRALTTTITKLSDGEDIFGAERYQLAAKEREERHKVWRSADKQNVVTCVESFARAVGCHPLIASSISSAADEMVSNALYDAPVDAAGRPRYAHYARERAVELSESEAVEVSITSDGHRLYLAARDPFGSLAPERVVASLRRCFANARADVENKAGGAGLGLFQVFNVMHHLVINIDPGKCTEIIGICELSRSFRVHATRVKSFDVFLASQASVA
jgi:hypothetical protein